MMAGVKKRKIQWAISLSLVILYFYGLSAQAQYGGGSGRAEAPNLIYTAKHMNAIGANTSDYHKHFKLMADIDLSNCAGTDFNIIGITYGNPFTGVFDGNGHTISHLTIAGGRYLGLFGCLESGAEVRDLGLVDVNIANSGSFVGGLVGRNYRGYVAQCYSTGTVNGNDHVGGLVGYNSNGSVLNCYSTGAVYGGRYVGGLVGVNNDAMTNCYSSGAVSGEEKVGGMGKFSCIVLIKTFGYLRGDFSKNSGI